MVVGCFRRRKAFSLAVSRTKRRHGKRGTRKEGFQNQESLTCNASCSINPMLLRLSPKHRTRKGIRKHLLLHGKILRINHRAKIAAPKLLRNEEMNHIRNHWKESKDGYELGTTHDNYDNNINNDIVKIRKS